MPAIEIPPGETEEVIASPPRGAEYNVQVSGSDVYMSHRSQGVVREGRRVRAGDRVELKNLQSRSIYARNPRDSTDNAVVEVSKADFAIIFQTRAVQASVQADSDTEAAPATDNFETFEANNVDVSSTADVVTFNPPDRADFVHVLADTAGASVTCDVQFGTDGGPYIGPQFSGSGQDAVATRVAVFNPECEISFSGSATDLDYRIYAR